MEQLVNYILHLFSDPPTLTFPWSFFVRGEYSVTAAISIATETLEHLDFVIEIFNASNFLTPLRALDKANLIVFLYIFKFDTMYLFYRLRSVLGMHCLSPYTSF